MFRVRERHHRRARRRGIAPIGKIRLTVAEVTELLVGDDFPELIYRPRASSGSEERPTPPSRYGRRAVPSPNFARSDNAMTTTAIAITTTANSIHSPPRERLVRRFTVFTVHARVIGK